ncbi:MAG: hypothetical protein AAF333_01095 [Planctomycetota bacterium]
MAVGCAERPAWEQADARPVPTPETAGWESLTADERPRRWRGGVTTFARQHPGVPNAGLQLPRVSPNGEWVTFLDVDRQGGVVPSDAWLTGRGLEGVSLWLRRVEDDGLARNVAYGYAAWPTWSPDGARLVFVSHDPGTGCALVIHDVMAQRSQRLAVGIQKMVTPAVSPDGTRVAVAGYGELPDRAVLFVVDLKTGEAVPGPRPTLGGAQLMPVWLDDDTLLYVELDEAGGGLMRWRPGRSVAEPVAPLALPASIFDAVHLHAGIARPISPDAQRFAYYAVPNDRVELVELSTATATPLERGDRAGAWWGRDWFIVADNDQLALVAPPRFAASQSLDDVALGADTEEADDAPRSVESPRMVLLPGRWVPLWTDAASHSMILIGPGELGRFDVLQLWAVTR